MYCYKITDKTGKLVGFKAVDEDDEIMIVTTAGIIIRTKVDGVSIQGRSASGVKLMNLDDGVAVASVAKVRQTADEGLEEVEAEETEAEETEAETPETPETTEAEE